MRLVGEPTIQRNAHYRDCRDAQEIFGVRDSLLQQPSIRGNSYGIRERPLEITD